MVDWFERTETQRRAYARFRGELAWLIGHQPDPLVAYDLIYNLFGYANSCAAEGDVGEELWVECVLQLARRLVTTAAAWREEPWQRTLEALAHRIDLEDFESAVRDDLWLLPEADRPAARPFRQFDSPPPAEEAEGHD